MKKIGPVPIYFSQMTDDHIYIRLYLLTQVVVTFFLKIQVSASIIGATVRHWIRKLTSVPVKVTGAKRHVTPVVRTKF